MKIIVLKSEDGKITSDETVEGEIGKVVKDTASKALGEWNEDSSDFIIIKDFHEVRIPLPLNPKLYETLKKFPMSKQEKTAVIRIPSYVISFDNVWMENDSIDRKVYVVSYFLDDKTKQELMEDAMKLTSPERESQDNEDIGEIEEEEE
jgi:hypothetical protein